MVSSVPGQRFHCALFRVVLPSTRPDIQLHVPAHFALSERFAASGGRLASAYDVYWVYTHNTGGGIKWLFDPGFPNSFFADVLRLNTFAESASLELGNSKVDLCGMTDNDHALRFK